MLDPALQRSLAAQFPSRQVLTNPAQLSVYQLDAGMERHTPDGVLILAGIEDMQRLMRWAQEHQVPVVPRGAGTGYTGGSIASQGGVLVCLAQMSAILEVDETSRMAIVQPGVVNDALQHQLRPLGLYYPPDPASQSVCTLGGNIAENAGGPHCLKYGVTSNYVVGLDAVLADGRVVCLGGKALDPPEYDFTGLLTGSEGTLALIASATLRLCSPHESVTALTASYASVAQAGDAVSAVIAAGLMPATIELMDNGMINIVEDYLQSGLPRTAAAMLIIDIDGYSQSLEGQLEAISSILEQYDPLDVRLAHTPEERDLLWRGRRSAGGAVARISPNEYLVDVSVPRSRLGEALLAINAIGERYGYRICYLAHAGDGNLHPNLLCDFSIPGEQEKVLRAAGEILTLCAGMGGSIGGEHGIGLEKREYLSAMYSPGEINAMLEVKDLFDPNHLLNPGKIFPTHIGSSFRNMSATAPVPGRYFEPANAAEAADGLQTLQSAGNPVYISGGGTQWRGDAPAGTMLSTKGLGGIVDLSTADLTVTVRTGMKISELQDILQRKGFWVAMATLNDEGTIGGALAANLNAPLRTLYGGLRDQVLASRVAFADGRTLSFGRALVKDIAGYSMTKLFTGSYGTLGLITEATLKLYPLPRTRGSLLVTVPDLEQGIAWGLAVLRSAIVCSGIVLVPGRPGDANQAGFTLIYTAEGHFDDVAAELSKVRVTLERCGPGDTSGTRASGGAMAPSGDETPFQIAEISATHAWRQTLTNSACLVRIAVPPSSLPMLAARIPLVKDDLPFVLDIANGMLYLTVQPANISIRLQELQKEAETLGGYVVLASGDRYLFSKRSSWGKPRSAYNLMCGLKLRWDPKNILNRGEFIFPLSIY